MSRDVDTRQRTKIIPPIAPTAIRSGFIGAGVLVAMVAWNVDELGRQVDGAVGQLH